MLTIVIPTYEQGGHGPRMLHMLLDSMAKQIYNGELEVLISDNSRNDKVKQVSDKWASILPIRHVYNHEAFGHCENFNFALDQVQGDKIKLMCQDDLLLQTNALKLFDEALEHSQWCVSNSIHIDDHGRWKYKKTVAYNPHEFDKNITGMPSVVGFHRNELRFDVRLRTYCDLWFYRQLHDLYGMPEFIREYCVGQRFWRHSASRTLPAKHAEDRQLIKNILNEIHKPQ